MTSALHTAVTMAIGEPSAEAARPERRTACAGHRTIDAMSAEALDNMMASTPAARSIALESVAVLVFPLITKTGPISGDARGRGAMRRSGEFGGYFHSFSASGSIPKSVNSFAYAVFLMNEKTDGYLVSKMYWEIGIGPRIAIVNEGMAEAMFTAAPRADAYVFGPAARNKNLDLNGTIITMFP